MLQDAGGAALAVAFEFLGGAVGVGESFPGAGASFELDVGQVDGVDEQLPDAAGEHVGVDAGVGGDAGHQSGLCDAELSGGECVVPHGHGSAEAGFLDAAVGFGAGELQVVFHPVLRGEEPEITERLCGVEVIGHGDAGGVGLAAELFDAGGPRRSGCRVEAGGVEGFEQRHALCAVLDRGRDPLGVDDTGVGADGDVGDRIEPACGIGREPDEPVTEPGTEPDPARRRRRLAATFTDPGILDNDHDSIMTRGCHTVPETGTSRPCQRRHVSAAEGVEKAVDGDAVFAAQAPMAW